MTFWVEVHCDVNANGCAGRANNYPARHVTSRARRDTMKDLYALEWQATKQGWRRAPDGTWACPPCQKLKEGR